MSNVAAILKKIDSFEELADTLKLNAKILRNEVSKLYPVNQVKKSRKAIAESEKTKVILDLRKSMMKKVK